MTGKMGLGALMVLGLSAILSTDAAAQGGRGGGMMAGGRGLAALLSNEGVQKELKLDEDQTTKAKELADKAREKMTEMRSTLEGLEGQERMEKSQSLSQEINAGIKKDASEFLKADQLARLVQIDYQNRGPSIFNDADVQSKLKITDDQKVAIKEIIQESQDEMRSIFTNGGGGGGNTDEAKAKRAESMTKLAEFQKGVKQKIEAKFTDDQKKAWKELIGSPFEVKFAPRTPRGT